MLLPPLSQDPSRLFENHFGQVDRHKCRHDLNTAERHLGINLSGIFCIGAATRESMSTPPPRGKVFDFTPSSPQWSSCMLAAACAHFYSPAPAATRPTRGHAHCAVWFRVKRPPALPYHPRVTVEDVKLSGRVSMLHLTLSQGRRHWYSRQSCRQAAVRLESQAWRYVLLEPWTSSLLGRLILRSS